MTEFHLVNDGVPKISTEIIKNACNNKNISYIEHSSQNFVFEPERRISPGNILFRPAISLSAMRVEQFLYQPGVSTFYKSTWGVLYSCTNTPLLFEATGIPIPRSFYLNQGNREVLDYYVSQLGGFPVILKVIGSSRGIGVMKFDNKDSFYSVVDYVLSSGQLPVLSAFIDNAIHWRCTVVGKKVVAAYFNPVEADDFRTFGSTNKQDIFTDIDPELEATAVQATNVLGIEFGGVDILQHDSGRYYVLECNFPCYYAHAQEHGGIDVAEAMVEFLLQKVKTLGRNNS